MDTQEGNPYQPPRAVLVLIEPDVAPFVAIQANRWQRFGTNLLDYLGAGLTVRLLGLVKRIRRKPAPVLVFRARVPIIFATVR